MKSDGEIIMMINKSPEEPRRLRSEVTEEKPTFFKTHRMRGNRVREKN